MTWTGTPIAGAVTPTGAPAPSLGRFLIGEPAVLEYVAHDSDGEELAISGAVSIEIFDGAGVAVHNATPSITTGHLHYTVPAGVLAQLDTYRVEWSGTASAVGRTWITTLEAVGGLLCELADLRAFEPSLADKTRFPASLLRNARTQAEETIETNAMVAFVPRGRRIKGKGDGTGLMILPDVAIREILAVKIDGVSLTASELAALSLEEWGAVNRAADAVWPAGSVIEVHYAHGSDRPPAAVTRAAMVLTADRLSSSAIPSRATSQSTDLGVVRFTLAGRDGPTGIPDVDAVIEQYGRRRPIVG